MKVIKENVKSDIVSCSFCDKSALRSDYMGLNYPYDEVITLVGDFNNGAKSKVSICLECLKELNDKVDSLIK